jgi:hypothetical protein
MLRESDHAPRLRSPRYREKVQQAIEYRQKIEGALLEMRPGVLRNYLMQSTSDLAQWIGMIFSLAERLDTHEHDEILKRDSVAASAAVQDLQRQMRASANADTRQQIQAVLDARLEQRESLANLGALMEQAQFRLEETLTSLGTAYSQFLMIRAQKAESTAHQDLSRRMQGQVQELQDILSSMQQVYSASQRHESEDKGEPVLAAAAKE